MKPRYLASLSVLSMCVQSVLCVDQGCAQGDSPMLPGKAVRQRTHLQRRQAGPFLSVDFTVFTGIIEVA